MRRPRWVVQSCRAWWLQIPNDSLKQQVNKDKEQINMDVSDSPMVYDHFHHFQTHPGRNIMEHLCWDSSAKVSYRLCGAETSAANLAMSQYLLIPFLGGWTSIYQLFWCSLGTRVLTHPHLSTFLKNNETPQAPIRHVLIRDLAKVAAAMKQPWPLTVPCGHWAGFIRAGTVVPPTFYRDYDVFSNH